MVLSFHSCFADLGLWRGCSHDIWKLYLAYKWGSLAIKSRPTVRLHERDQFCMQYVQYIFIFYLEPIPRFTIVSATYSRQCTSTKWHIIVNTIKHSASFLHSKYISREIVKHVGNMNFLRKCLLWNTVVSFPTEFILQLLDLIHTNFKLTTKYHQLMNAYAFLRTSASSWPRQWKSNFPRQSVGYEHTCGLSVVAYSSQRYFEAFHLSLPAPLR